jgi:hypothetical protein
MVWRSAREAGSGGAADIVPGQMGVRGAVRTLGGGTRWSTLAGRRERSDLPPDAKPSIPYPCRVPQRPDTTPPVTSPVDLQTRALRAMTADEKVRVSQALWEETWEVLGAGVRGRHPEWTPAQVLTRVRELLRDVHA